MAEPHADGAARLLVAIADVDGLVPPGSAVDDHAAANVFKDGLLVDLQPDEKNRAKDLIADLMIATNGATARFLVDKGFPSIRRFLQSPRRWDRIVALAAGHGVTLPALPDAIALDGFLSARRAADPAGFADLSLSVVKMLGSGEYAALPRPQPTQRMGWATSAWPSTTTLTRPRRTAASPTW